MKVRNFFKKIIQWYGLATVVMVILVVSVKLGAMEKAFSMENAFPMGHQIFIKTNDNKVLPIARWKLDEMKGLLVLLEHQKGKNSEQNPINAPMISSQESELLSSALSKASELGNSFELFWHNLVEKDKKNGLWKKGQPLCPSQTLLVNAAQAVEASGLSALCLSYFLHTDVQKKLLVPQFMDSVISCLEGKRKIVLENHDVVGSVAMSPDGITIAFISDASNNLILWDIRNLNDIKKRILVGHPQPVTAIAFNYDGTKIVSGCRGRQNNLIVWDISDKRVVIKQDIAGCPFGVKAVAFNADGTKIVVGGDGESRNLMLWDIRNKNNISNTVIGDARFVNSVVISPDDTRIIVGCDSERDSLIVWDISNQENKKHVINNCEDVSSIAISSDGKRLVVGRLDTTNQVIVLDISNWNAISGYPIVDIHSNVGSVALSSDGKKLIAGSWADRDNLIMWDISDPKNIIKQFVVSLPSVKSVACNADGTRIVSGSRIGFSFFDKKQFDEEDKKNNLILWILLLNSEIQALKNCNIAQARLMWQLCLRCSHKLPLTLVWGSLDCALFMSLPNNIQQLLENFLGVTSGSKKIVENQP